MDCLTFMIGGLLGAVIGLIVGGCMAMAFTGSIRQSLEEENEIFRSKLQFFRDQCQGLLDESRES